MQNFDTMTPEELTHQVSNDALSIIVGTQLLRTIPEELLSAQQLRALQILESSAESIVEAIDVMKNHEAFNAA